MDDILRFILSKIISCILLTEQTDFSQYMAMIPACRNFSVGRDQPEAQKEEALFYNLNSTRTPKPVDYPQDNITTPNQAVAKLNGSDPDKRIGPSIILKVMAGDTIQAAVRAYYKQEADPKKKVSIPAEQMLAGMLQALVAPGTQALTAHRESLARAMQTTGPGLTANDLQSLKQKDPNNKNLDKPKAYLNYVFFDKQLNFVEDGSGVKQVDGETGELETLSSGKVVAKKNGYVYVFTSNESSQDVLFDNFGVMQISGPVLEETHYYPFGLTMTGISTTAPLKIEAKRKFNGIEFNHKEFSDGSGLDLYTAKFRGLDPQIGRWWQIDPKPSPGWSPYSAMSDNPIFNTDILGDTTYRFNQSNGKYIGMYDLKQKGQRGSYGMMKTIRKGKNKLKQWDGQYFNFADPVNDPEDIRNGTINKLVFVSEKDIQSMMKEQGAFKSGKLNFARESQGGGNFDYSFTILPKKYPKANFNGVTMKSNSLFLPKGDHTAHNFMNFGNYLWGATGYTVGFNYGILQLGAETNSLLNSRRNGYPSQLDSKDDQRSIKLGIFHAEINYYRMLWK